MRIIGKVLLALLGFWWLMMFVVYLIAGDWTRAAWFLALDAALLFVVWRKRVFRAA